MKRYFCEKSPNLKWNIGENIGKNFEDFVSDLIKMQLKNLHPQVKVIQTNQVGDGGKDIIVTAETDHLVILGQNFSSYDNKNIKIYFECKSTNDQILRYDKIAPSTSRVQFQNINYYVLVTNSEILPQSYWYIAEELASKDIKFKLIDSFLLGTSVASLGFKDVFDNPYKKSGSFDFYYEYQIEELAPQQTNKYNIYLLFRNYTNLEKHCILQLKTNVDWDISETNISFVIAPNGAIVKKVTVNQTHFDGIPDLLFNMQVNGTESTVMINGINGMQFFEPPFFGEDRKKIISKLEYDLKSSNQPNSIYFWGDAGIGKTRLVKELLVKLQGTYFDIYECKIQKGSSPELGIRKFLSDKNYIENDNNSDFSTFLSHCKNYFGKSAIIIIDDFHNATKEFMEQIKKFNDCKNIVTLIICGRTDFSVGDINYFSFVHWSRTENSKYCFDIEPLGDEETKSFIKVLIDGIPEYALNKLFNLSMKNPLFIVQYIEYLLDCNLVKLQNRNTVGIININQFHSKCFIPKKIADIYKLRINNLLEQEQGIKCLELLFKMGICNGRISSKYFFELFENDLDNLSELLKRRLLKYDQDERITFIHESLFLYINEMLDSKKKLRKSIATKMLCKPDLKNILNDLQMGKMHLYAKDYDGAKLYFKPIIDWVSQAENISNINVNLEYYEYLNDIFELCRHKQKSLNIAKKALLMRVYITLHHFAPINAANECDSVLKTLDKFKLNDDKKFQLSILELKAHALMNSGLYTDGETLLKEIQIQWLLDKNILDNETLFDLYDRLASVYKHFNLSELAKEYNILSMNLAESLQDSKLQMLANRSRFKIYLYMDMDSCKTSLQESIALNQINPSKRIKTDNDLDVCGIEILNNQSNEWDSIIKQIITLLDYVEENNFSRAKIHGYFLLAICNLLKNSKNSIFLAKEYTKKAIDLSTSYGIVGYMWRLNNLNAIIQMRLNDDGEMIYKSFFSVFEILQSRGLLYIGNRDLCHGNILALSNIGYYLQEHKYESLFYEKMSLVTYTDKNRYTSTKESRPENPIHPFLVHQYNQAKNKKVLFTDFQPSNLLRDRQTNYIIII